MLPFHRRHVIQKLMCLDELSGSISDRCHSQLRQISVDDTNVAAKMSDIQVAVWNRLTEPRKEN